MSELTCIIYFITLRQIKFVKEPLGKYLQQIYVFVSIHNRRGT